MGDDEFRELASRLELAADADAAKSQLSSVGERQLWLTGNRDALLHFAASFLRAAAAPIADNEIRSDVVEIEIERGQIVESKSDHVLAWVQRIDTFTEKPHLIAKQKRAAWRRDRVALLGCAVAGFLLARLLLSGVLLWWHLITGTPLL